MCGAIELTELVGKAARHRKDAPGFVLQDQCCALNGRPQSRFDEALSLSVDCQSQEELDDLRNRLSAGGTRGRGGWLRDCYGLSWQIVPGVLPQLLGAGRGRAPGVVDALIGMTSSYSCALEATAEAA